MKSKMIEAFKKAQPLPMLTRDRASQRGGISDHVPPVVWRRLHEGQPHHSGFRPLPTGYATVLPPEASRV